MKETFFGTISFVLFLFYDLEQTGTVFHRFHKLTKCFFTIGSLFLIAVTISLLWSMNILQTEWNGKKIIFLILSVIFLLLLIYTLFFALPFEETYVAQNTHRTYDKKMYALCRHPGVLWFAGFYFCLWLAFGTKPLFAMATWFSLLNFCYVVLQDLYTFPRIFPDYGEYKKRVPFLIPNGKSLKRCIDTFKESR